MQKKLALACTLIHTPQVIFLDEPTTGVDPISRREFWDILADLHVQGVTLFVSTPYMDEAERCSRVGLMYEGRIVECDTPDALRRRVPGDLLAVWTADVPAARKIVRGLPGVLEVQTYGDVLHVFVADAADAAPAIRAALAAAGIPVTDIKQTTPRVEEAFISLIQGRRRREGLRQDQSNRRMRHYRWNERTIAIDCGNHAERTHSTQYPAHSPMPIPMPITPYAVITEDLTKTFDHFVAVNHISFTRAAREHLRLPGPERLGQDDDDPHVAGAAQAIGGPRDDPGLRLRAPGRAGPPREPATCRSASACTTT